MSPRLPVDTVSRGLILALLLSGAPLAADDQPSPPPRPPAEAVYSRFVVLADAGGETVAYARAIIAPGYTCPAIGGGSAPQEMTTRDNPHNFPVIVCEAEIGFDQNLELLLAGTPLELPTVRRDPERILVFGDTGCKRYQPGSNTGCAAGTPAEPFASLATAAAQGPAPDLLLHVGDYNYRGTGNHVLFTVEENGRARQQPEWPYDAGHGSEEGAECNQGQGVEFWSHNAPNSNYPDTWEDWRDDFFAPAEELLPLAPWVFARGNHELCSYSGPGWFYFLDPSSNLGEGQLQCPEPSPGDALIDNVVLSRSYAVDLGSLQILVLDSANACDFFTNPTFEARYERQVGELAELAAAEGTAWLLSHRPFWSIAEYHPNKSTGCTPENRWACMNQTLQAALDRAPGGSLPASVELLLAGHVHRFQSVTFPQIDRPPVVVVGNGGVALDDSPPHGQVEVSVDGDPAHTLTTGAEVTLAGKSVPAFGYLDVSYSADGWSGEIQTLAGTPIAVCGSEQQARGSVCELAPGVEVQ